MKTPITIDTKKQIIFCGSRHFYFGNDILPYNLYMQNIFFNIDIHYFDIETKICMMCPTSFNCDQFYRY